MIGLNFIRYGFQLKLGSLYIDFKLPFDTYGKRIIFHATTRFELDWGNLNRSGIRWLAALTVLGFMVCAIMQDAQPVELDKEVKETA